MSVLRTLRINVQAIIGTLLLVMGSAYGLAYGLGHLGISMSPDAFVYATLFVVYLIKRR